jgi:predicted negative regulator of RcsB-dependent stress response
MSEHKEMRKTLKSPDQFQIFMAKFIDWMLINRAFLVASVCVVAVLVVGMWGWKEVERRRTETLRNAFSAIEIKYQDEDRALDGQRKEIQDKIAAIDPKAADQTAKNDLEAQLINLKAKHEGSLVEYQKFFAANGNKPEGQAAGFKAASILFSERRFDDARKVVDQLVKLTEKVPVSQLMARSLLVTILEETGNTPEALKECEALLGKVPEEFKPQVLLTRARLQRATNANDAALKTLDEILSKYGQSREAERARAMKSVLF